MTDDLVKRLRGHAESYDIDAWMSCDEAADRIEALNKRNKELEAALQQIADIDYRGNAHPSLHIARAALGEKKNG